MYTDSGNENLPQMRFLIVGPDFQTLEAKLSDNLIRSFRLGLAPNHP